MMVAVLVTAENQTIPTFFDAHQQAGINVRVVSGDAEKRFLIESVGGGIGVIDYNNDGWMDLYVVNGATLDELRAGKRKNHNVLYRNNGDGTFTDVTAQARVEGGEYWGKGVLVFDYNNDGFDDIYVCNFGPNILYRNNGDGTFTDVTKQAGVGDARWSSAAAAADYDGDGYLDLFVANYLDYDINHLPVEGKFCSYKGIPVACGPRGLKGAGDALYHNNGDGTFTDVSEKAGVADKNGYYGLGAVWGDYNNDGRPDLYVANDSTPHYLYRNEGNGTFTEVGVPAGVAFSEDGREQAGMGVDFEDYDNDGWLDIVVTNFSDDYNTIYHNSGKGFFTDASVDAGIAADSQRDLSWGVGFFDFNNDGFKDLFIANGHIYPQLDRYGLKISYRQQNKLYLNDGHGKFVNVTGQAGSGMQPLKSYRGAAFADFNNDGYIDVAVVALDDAPSLLINQGKLGNHWVVIKLVGTRSNRRGVGARISVTTEEGNQIREIKAGGSFASSNDPRAHFGLGKSKVIRQLQVKWPSGRITILKDVAADRVVEIREE
ncbi:MAG TPA: CRTAC1 family protein [Acidobacteriota bacterium]